MRIRGRFTTGAGRRVALAGLIAALAAAAIPNSAGAVATIFDQPVGLPDLDVREQAVAPSAAQRRLVDGLGARASWNRFGTPESLINDGGYLGSRPAGSASDAARAWIRANRGLFKLTDADVSGLAVLSDSQLRGTGGHAVIFNQRFGGLEAGQDGMITVGINSQGVFYASSSSAGSQAAPEPATLSPTQAWRSAAANAGLSAKSSAISDVHTAGGWTTFTAAGLATPLDPRGKGPIGQRARLVAFPTDDGVRAAFETIVMDVDSAGPKAYKSFVDARTGEVLFRQNAVEQLAAQDANDTFSGTTNGPNDCGPRHPIGVETGIRSIFVFASANLPADDIVLKLFNPHGVAVASADTGSSPEAISYSKANGGVLEAGTWRTQVCQFDHAVPAFDYSGTWATSSSAVNPTTPNPAWKYFEANPPLDYSNTDSRIVGCWIAESGAVPPCDRVEGNLASRAPWDVLVGSGSTLTTEGNNARTAESWTNPLAPGPFGFMPTATDRKYAFGWTNQWQTSGCDPATLVPTSGNDIAASVTNLFVGHNRFHDFSYRLGFTEDNFNMQTDNFGSVGGRAADPEIGDVQAGALTGGFPTFEGRDNANQITLNDGIPGITNQYLFQPIAGAFYSPCVDGDYDTSVFGHEYTHAISNRMVGGPDSGLTGAQAGAMGESWSDLNALEYLHAYDYVPTAGENDWAEGPYVTGNPERGIRDFALNDNPLNYSDIGFDVTGPEVHADGEIWNAVNYDVRQALARRYDANFPSGNAALQLRCAEGELPVDRCPGNRRWIQLVFDAFLLQPPTTSMLDARDAMLASDINRFGGQNQATIWNAFAKRGFGESAQNSSTDEDQPHAAFDSPHADEATVTLDPRRPDGGLVDTRFFIGRFEARATPVADTYPETSRSDTVSLVPGRYELIAQARGYGMRRFQINVSAGETVTETVHLDQNWASERRGATATGDGTDQANLIDDTEATQWEVTGLPANVDVARPSVTVDLAGGAHTIRSVKVSAMLGPGQGRFTALRRFAIQTCRRGPTVTCALPGDFATIYTSPAAAFPSVRPRPVAPDLILRPFAVPATSATDVRLVALENQCTGGPDFAGEQDNDPVNPTDCATGSAAGADLHAAELQVFSANAP